MGGKNLKKIITKKIDKTMKQINYLKAYNAIFEVASILSNEKEDRKVRANKAFQILSSDMIKAFYVMRNVFESDARIDTGVHLLDFFTQFPNDTNASCCFDRAAEIFIKFAEDCPSDLVQYIWSADHSYYFYNACKDAMKHHREVMARMLSCAKSALYEGGKIVACWEVADNGFFDEDVTGLDVDEIAEKIFSYANLKKSMEMMTDSISFYFTVYGPDGECLGNTFVDTFNVTEDIFQRKMEKYASEKGIFDEEKEEDTDWEMPF